METEKYYGLYEPDKTTKIDSSNIDCKLPGNLPGNPSLNTTNTSLLNKASTTSNYKKLNNCPQTFILKDHNDAITDSSLLVIEYGFDTGNGIEIMYEYRLENNGNKKQVYLGYEDTNKIFTNKLGTIITTQVTTLDSDTAGCSAKAYLIPNDNTGAPIKFSLNTCTQDRLITFSYKNTPIFQIQQTYKKELKIGDVLYSTADEKLTLDAQTNGANNTPIAICVIPEVYENIGKGDNSDGAVKTARFVSLNYMNYNTPTTGNKDTQTMYFGNYSVTVGNVKGGIDETSYVGGIWNTKRCVFNATNQDKTSDKVENKYDAGYCAPACCCERYSTLGTNPGDWYLPMPGELYQIYANKTIINEKRTAIKGSGFADNIYWSSREENQYNEYLVRFDNSYIRYDNKNKNHYVLGFLAVEVQSFNISTFNIPSVNMTPVKLDASSSKKKPAVADILYSTADGKLTLDAQTNSVNNTPIAICVIPEVMENFKNGDNSAGAVKTARFVSLNYMNPQYPTSGQTSFYLIDFGHNGVTIGNTRGDATKDSCVGGKWNTQQCLSKATKQDPYLCNGVTDKGSEGYCAPVCCCVAYSTLGTKPGDWYLPSVGELYQLHANRVDINNARSSLSGYDSGFSDDRYWSSREHSISGEYYVNLDSGKVSYYGKDSAFLVLGFLALGV